MEKFKKSINEKNCVKIIAGIDNYDPENILKVVKAADKGGANAVDISAREDIIKLVKENTDLTVFVSSTEPEKMLMAKQNGADALEIGNFDAYYKQGKRVSAEEVKDITKKTINLVGKEILLCVTIPGHIEISEQIELAREIEALGVDFLQTEGASTIEVKSSGARGLMEKAIVSIANTAELVKNVDIPVITASGITSTTAPMAFAAGASAVGVGSAVNKLSSEIEMLATVKSITEKINSSKNSLSETSV